MEEENPFGDPSVQNAVSTSAKNMDLDDYNPFDGKTQNQSPAVMNPTEDMPPAAAPPPQTQPKLSTADFQKRQEELERRAQELDRREAELRSAPQNVRRNNWPPVPGFCPVQPCFYQDINVDIPVEFQKIVKRLYYLWIGHASLLIANFVTMFLFLCVGGDSAPSYFGLSLVYGAIFTPASYVCWFRPAYKAFRDDSSLYFMIFFFVFFFQTIVSVLYCLGIGGMGSSGFIVGFQTIGAGGGPGKIFVGILQVIMGAGFGVAGLADFYLLTTIHKMYRSTGASMAKAQAEFTSGVMSNEHVRQAAAQAATEAARSQFSGGNNQAGNSGNRY